MAHQNGLKRNDVIVSRVEGGHHLLEVTGQQEGELSLVYRGDGWNIQYAVAKGARLASRNGGNLWYSTDALTSLEYLETFRSERRLVSVH